MMDFVLFLIIGIVIGYIFPEPKKSDPEKNYLLGQQDQLFGILAQLINKQELYLKATMEYKDVTTEKLVAVVDKLISMEHVIEEEPESDDDTKTEDLISCLKDKVRYTACDIPMGLGISSSSVTMFQKLEDARRIVDEELGPDSQLGAKLRNLLQ